MAQGVCSTFSRVSPSRDQQRNSLVGPQCLCGCMSPVMLSRDMQVFWNWEASFSVQWPWKPIVIFSLTGHLRMCAHEGGFTPISAVSVQMGPKSELLGGKEGTDAWWLRSQSISLPFSPPPDFVFLFLLIFSVCFFFFAGTWGQLVLLLPDQVPLSNLNYLHLWEGSREASPILFLFGRFTLVDY